jgi:DNA-directed RNA polymerase subunit RPC12/RpoP
MKHYGLCTNCGKKGMYKIEPSRKGYTTLKCRYCGKKENYSS